MKRMFDFILHGGDYNPNQWDRDIWAEDMRLLRKAGINCVTINVFSWARLQPAEDVYDFETLDAIIEMLCREGMSIILATSTAALPAWMVKKYPEMARMDYEGRRHKFGQRHNACPNSLVYQRYAGRMAAKLAERYAGNPHIVCWHINNEYGGVCYCDQCEKAFQVWLRAKYETLEALNKAWNTEFWGHTFYSWDEIVVPNILSDEMGDGKTAFAGISIDYCRFNSDSLLENYKMERDAVRAYDTQTPITTNLMGTYKQLDYFKWAKEMDIVSWDHYPAFDTPWSKAAMSHDLMRGLKGQPFMLMEQTPSQQNWQPYNSLKKPGQMRAQSYQTLAHGAETILYFQLRRSVGGCEKFHGAVIGHVGNEHTRVFREVTQLGEELQHLGDLLLGSANPKEVGIVFDWDNYWALEYTSGPHKELKYVEQIHQYYRYFYEHNIAVDMIPVDADFSQYKLIVAPVLYMVKEGVADALSGYVEAGGTLVTGFMSGIVDASDNVHLGGYPGPLRQLTGIWVEEIDALSPDQSNTISFADETQAQCRMLCDIIHLEGARCLAEYTSNFYAGSPAVTYHQYGEGLVYYVGTVLAQEALGKVLDHAAHNADVRAMVEEAAGLEVVCRQNDTGKLYFVMNFEAETHDIPPRFWGRKDLLTGAFMAQGMQLAQYGVCLFQIDDAVEKS